MRPLINENKQQLDKKEKMQNYVILFFRKKFVSKDMKAINFKMKNWIGSFILPNTALETYNYP